MPQVKYAIKVWPTVLSDVTRAEVNVAREFWHVKRGVNL